MTLRAIAGGTFKPATESEFSTTDAGNAERFVARYGHIVRHVRKLNRTFIFTGRRWVPDETDFVIELAKRTVDSIYREAAASTANEQHRRELSKWAMASESEQRLRAMVNLARSSPRIAATTDFFDADPWMLGVENGVVDLRTGLLRQDCRDLFITRVAAARFDPDATAPLWESSLARWIPDEPVRVFLRRFVGYALVGKVQEQLLVVLWGEGANGKTTMLEIVRHVFGGYALNSPADLLLARRDDGPLNEVARLHRTRLSTVTEFEENARLAEARVKRLTGGDKFTARFLYSEHFDFEPTAKFIVATNHKPRIRGTDSAIWRRIALVPFSVTIPEADRDPSLLDKLKAESAGILNWMVQGCLEWQAHGLGVPPEVRGATESYRVEQDRLAEFFTACCIFAPTAWTSNEELFGAYRRWCSEVGDPENIRDLRKRLRERSCQPTAKNRGRGWKGIGLVEDTTP
jgi:putative DNA primase/helicase